MIRRFSNIGKLGWANCYQIITNAHNKQNLIGFFSFFFFLLGFLLYWKFISKFLQCIFAAYTMVDVERERERGRERDDERWMNEYCKKMMSKRKKKTRKLKIILGIYEWIRNEQMKV